MGDQSGASDPQISYWDAHRVSANGMWHEKEMLVREVPLLVRVNGTRVAVMMRTPGMDAELVTGFCVCEGIVESANDMASVALASPSDDPLGGDVAEVRLVPGAVYKSRSERIRMVQAVAGDVGAHDGMRLPVVRVDVSVRWRALAAAAEDLAAGQVLRSRAGGVHAFGLYQLTGERLVVCEDIGRHNAMDKAVGWCIRRDLGARWAFGLCSGRLSHEMVAKAARAGLPILASFSSPSSLGVASAERCHITVVGYLERSQALVYTHPERLVT